MRSESAATPSREPECAQPLSSVQESVALYLSKIRDYALLKILDILEPRRTIASRSGLEARRSFDK